MDQPIKILKTPIKLTKGYFIKYEKYDQNVVVPLSDMSFSKVGNSGHFDPEYQHYKNVMKIILNDIFF